MGICNLINHGWTRIWFANAHRYYVMACAVMLGGLAIAAESISITATPRYPWNGKVDLKFTIDGTSGTKYDTSFTAKDVAGGTNLTMKTLYKSNGVAANVAKEQLLPGTYNWVWDATADLGEWYVGSRVTVSGRTVQAGFPVITNGLVAWWPFDGDIKDHSGNGHHLTGAVAYDKDRDNQSKSAVKFDGSGYLSQTTDLGVTGSMTFSCWVGSPTHTLSRDDIEMYLAAVGRGNFGQHWVYWPLIVFPASVTDGRGVGFSVAANRINVFANGEWFNVILDYSCDISSGWHHVAVTIGTSNSPVLYLDGVKVKEGSSAWNGFVPKLSNANTIGGGDYRAGGKYKGQLDDLCIYNRILSANEIKALYDAR